MKTFYTTLCFVCVAFLSQCSHQELTREEVKRLLSEGKAYPAIVEYKIFCGSDSDAKKLHASGLVDDSLVVAQLAHTPEDVGRPLISFTKKAKPYLIATSDTLKSIDVQKVKIADEVLGDITDIKFSPDKKSAVVEYTIAVLNLTPFSVLTENRLLPGQQRKTYFTFQSGRWMWEGKIVKMP
jgi:hypothetical protein